MYRDSACSDPNTVREGGLAKDGFSQTLPICNTSFSMEELSYLQNPSQQDASEAINGAAMEIGLQQQLGLDMGNVGNTDLMQEVVRDSDLQVLPYDQTNWDTNVNHEMQEVSFIPNPHHPQEGHLRNLEIENGHRQSFNDSPFQNTPYPPATDLNLFHLPRCSPSSVLTNSTSLNFMNPTQKYAKFPASLDFLGDLPPHDSAAQASNVVHDPLVHLNLPPQPPIFGETFLSLPYGYNLAASRTVACSLFGGGVDEREARGDVYRDGEGEDRHFDNNGLFEFNGDMNCMANGSNGKGSDKHFATEKQRRLDLTAKFTALKNLVPNPTKADRASIVGDAVEYIKELLRTVDELKILVEKKRYGRERRKRHKTEDGANGEFESSKVKPEPDDQSYNGSSRRSSWLQRKSKDTEVDVRIVDDEVTIKLAQRKKMNCLLIVSKVLDELQLDIHHVAGGLVGDNYSFLFNSKICEGSSVYASAIANKLIEVVDRQHAAIPPTGSY